MFTVEAIASNKQNSSSSCRFYTNSSLALLWLALRSLSREDCACMRDVRYVTDICSSLFLRKFYKKLMSSFLPSQWRWDSGNLYSQQHVISFIVVLRHGVMQCSEILEQFDWRSSSSCLSSDANWWIITTTVWAIFKFICHNKCSANVRACFLRNSRLHTF